MFTFLKSKHNAVMVFDHSEHKVDESMFHNEDWSATVYGEREEEIPSNDPVVRGL